jgi:transposase
MATASASAIAVWQPTMRFVPIKSTEQQAILGWHSMREGWKEERTALINRVRALLAEFGLVIARSAVRLLAELPKLRDDPRVPIQVQALLLKTREELAASKPAWCAAIPESPPMPRAAQLRSE